MRRYPLRIALAVLAVLAVAAAPAAAQTEYPKAEDVLGAPTAKPKGKTRTLSVCRKGCRFKRIQAAVGRARKGDKIKVKPGTYRESVRVQGAKRAYLKIIGNTRNPSKVVIDGAKLRGANAQNGVFVNGTDGVRISGLTIRNFKANGVFITNVIDYEISDVVANKTGTYGLYAFNSVGGEMRDAVASMVNDGAFYVGQTPVQDEPRRTFIRNVEGHTSVIGFSGTNMRYVTITGSRFYNNAVGVVPNALSSERFPPATDNVITDNDIFWNNFNYYLGAPFELRQTTAGGVPFPPGIGVILLGGHRNVVEGNRIYGNWLGGVALVNGFALSEEDAAARNLENNRVEGNSFGLDGTDLNGRDLVYDGNGTGNCFSGNPGVAVTVPDEAAHFPGCPFTGANTFRDDVFSQMIGWALSEDHEAPWIRHEHAPKPGYTPLERWGG